MQKNKIGIIFVATVLSLTGIGISFAGFTDVINIYGEVSTATVDFVIKEYSCTYVWKIYNIEESIEEFEHFSVNTEKEIAIYQGPCIDPDQFEITVFQGKCDYERVAWAEAKAGDQDNEVDIEYSGLFPCIDFIGDVVIHYQGSIPGRIQWPEIVWESGDDLSDYVTIKTYEYTKENDVYIKGEEIPIGEYPYQVHYCDHVGWDVVINLPQENTLQEKSGEFGFIIHVIQWNECSEPTEDTDGDGIPDDQDNCPSSPNPNQEDTDGDGVGDVCDNCPVDPDKTEPGTCGCGIPDTDTDNDGTPDCNDQCPNDPDKTSPGVCGCGVADTDTDGDGVADCVDNCVNTPNPNQEDTDGDGIGDVCDDEIMHINKINMWTEQSEDCYYYMGMLIFCNFRTKGVAGIYIVDANNNPVQGAEVFGTWSGLASNSVNGITDPAGLVIFKSDIVEWSSLDPISGDFTITIDDVVKTGWIYDPSANVETSDTVGII